MESGGKPEQTVLFPNNPGFQDDWSRKLKDLFPVPLDGARVVLNRVLASRFQMAHTVNMGDSGSAGAVPGATAGPPPYSFQATCVGKAEHEELTPVFMAEIDNTGSLNGQIIKYINSRVRCKAVLQTQKSKWAMSQAALDYKGNSYSASLVAINPDLLACTGVLSSSFLKRITPKVDIGSDFTMHNAQGQLKTSMGVHGKYSGVNWEIFGNVNNAGFQTGYYHECSKTTTVGVEWECSSVQGESSVALGYKIDMTESGNFCLRGSIDSNGTLSAVYDKKMHPFTLTLSGSMNHRRGLSKFGLGFTIG